MRILHANAIMSSDSPGGHNAMVIDGPKIAACGQFESLRRRYPHADLLDLTDCVIVPGLVNAHSHLELSDLQNQVPFEGDFITWIRRVTQGRRESKTELSDTIANACRQSLAGGVTSLGDIAFRHRAWPHLAQLPIRKTCYAEVFGITSDLNSPQSYLERCIDETQEDELLRLGLSPHAPYSAGPGVYELAEKLAMEHQLPITTHLAETKAEIDFLADGSGGWRDFLKRIHLWDGSFTIPRKRPVQYFLGLDCTDTSFLLAHVNYINDEELDALAKTSHSVVFCPRSHRFFRHPPHRFRDMVAAGINLCLGTDSLASNSSLSILDEMRFLYHQLGYHEPDRILTMATINGAKAIGWSDKTGTIEPGKDADLTAIPLDHPGPNPLADILTSQHPPRVTMVRGQPVFQNES